MSIDPANQAHSPDYSATSLVKGVSPSESALASQSMAVANVPDPNGSATVHAFREADGTAPRASLQGSIGPLGGEHKDLFSQLSSLAYRHTQIEDEHVSAAASVLWSGVASDKLGLSGEALFRVRIGANLMRIADDIVSLWKVHSLAAISERNTRASNAVTRRQTSLAQSEVRVRNLVEEGLASPELVEYATGTQRMLHSSVQEFEIVSSLRHRGNRTELTPVQKVLRRLELAKKDAKHPDFPITDGASRITALHDDLQRKYIQSQLSQSEAEEKQ